ncbi:TonB-dependent receptor family protein [Flavobacteriaceae bacterium]|nr:TonB-dependent receptor family protein [Flavobacteriaceae bacterium]
MRFKFTILFLAITTSLCFSQKKDNNSYTLSGIIFDKETKQPLEYATVVLKNTVNNQVTGGISNLKGKFNISTEQGNYNISIEFLGFKTISIANKIITSDSSLGEIYLEEDNNSLEEVEIIAEKSTVEIKLDKKIYNVGKDMTVKGGSASDVLDNVPSVTVDIEGNVALRGNENVRILINGKPSGLVGGPDALRQLPADAILKVEVITSASARYDAEGTAGILNIILRKGKALGFNGSFGLNLGIPENIGVSSNLNYRNKKVNYFSTSGYTYNNAPGNAFFETKDIANIPSETLITENRFYERERKSFNTLFGLEYFITENASVTGSVFYRNSDRLNKTEINTNNSYLLASENTQKFRKEIENDLDKQIEFNLNFIQNFKTSGHKLSLDFKHEINNEEELATLTGNQFFPNIINDIVQKTDAIEHQKRILVQGDYVLPIGENAQFETGFRSNNSFIDTDFSIRDEQEDGSFTLDEDVSNIFIYNEKVHALYTQYGNKFDKFSGLLGMRMEVSDIDVNVTGTTLNSNKKYTEFFPTFNFAYELKENETVTLGFNRRIRRPRSWFINPFPTRASENNIFQGNPDLDPAYSNALDLGYLKKWNKITFNTSMYYNYTTDVFQRIESLDANNANVTITTFENIASEDRYGFEFSVNYELFKWWKLNNSFNVFSTKRNSGNELQDAKFTSWTSRFDSRIKLPFKIDWQTTINYRGPRETFQTKNKSITSINLAFSRDILKGNGTLSLNVSDLLNSRKRISNTNINGVSNRYSEFQWRERQVRLNFIYRLNQKKKRNQQRDNDSGEGGF